jgi:hypothetical protein
MSRATPWLSPQTTPGQARAGRVWISWRNKGGAERRLALTIRFTFRIGRDLARMEPLAPAFSGVSHSNLHPSLTRSFQGCSAGAPGQFIGNWGGFGHPDSCNWPDFWSSLNPLVTLADAHCDGIRGVLKLLRTHASRLWEHLPESLPRTSCSKNRFSPFPSPFALVAARFLVLPQSTVDLSLSLCSRFGANQNWLHQIRR